MEISSTCRKALPLFVCATEQPDKESENATQPLSSNLKFVPNAFCIIYQYGS